MPSLPPVAVTGIGIVSPIGVGRRAFWDNLVRGQSGIRPFEGARSAFPRVAAQVRDFEAKDFIHSTHLRRMDQLSRMVSAACTMALDEARFDHAGVTAEEIGIVVGSALGDVTDARAYLEKTFLRGPAAASPMTFPNLVHNAPASYAAMVTGATGVNLTVAQAEISGEQSILLGCDLVRSGRARVVLAGGADAFDPLVAEVAASAQALSGQRGGREWCSPYDAGRNGIVLGEGAAVLALEPVSQARERGARVYALIEAGTGFGVPAPPYDWPVDGSAAREPLRRLLSGHAADLVVGSANSSLRLDSCEMDLFCDLFGENGADTEVTSIKGAIGEFGAAGALSVAAGCLALHEQTVPPLCHLSDGPHRPPLRFAIRHGQPKTMDRVLVCGFARGGAAAGLLLHRSRAAGAQP